MTPTHGSTCVCDRSAAKTKAHVTPQKQNRNTAACVCNHTHAFAVGLVRHPTLPRIQYNYKRTNESESKADCIQNDYIGGGGCV